MYYIHDLEDNIINMSISPNQILSRNFWRYGQADSKMHIHKDIPGGLLAETPNSHKGGQVPSLVRELDPICHN